jgi:hypothetical protein
VLSKERDSLINQSYVTNYPDNVREKANPIQVTWVMYGRGVIPQRKMGCCDQKGNIHAATSDPLHPHPQIQYSTNLNSKGAELWVDIVKELPKE